jgi:hypothetical protein
MEIGELFLIRNLDSNLEEKVLWAANSYQKKYGHAPTLCLVHPSLIKGLAGRLAGLRVEAKKSVLPNYLWIGIPADAEAKPFAS